MFFGGSINRIYSISVDAIRPNRYQPRQVFCDEELHSLADSIRENGILQPLTVRKLSGNCYELIAGERRLRAAMLAGLNVVPCVLMDTDERQSAVLALLENLQRQDLGFFEEAEGISALMKEFGLTQEEAARKLGKKQSTVANKMRLLRLGDAQRKMIEENGLTERHARALLKLPEEMRTGALERIIRRGMNVAETERLVERLLEEQAEDKKAVGARVIVKDVRIFFNTVSHAIETMRQSGIDAVAEQVVTEEYIEYKVRIPKTKGSRAKRPA